MDPPEHLHIISAGDTIHKTYPGLLQELGTVTRTIIVAEKDIYTNSGLDDAQKRRWKCAIRDAIDEVNAISLSRNISCALVRIDAATFDAIRDPILGIFSDHPQARYTFDISAGSKRLSLGLFTMSLWVEGETYYAFGKSPARRVPVPTFPAKHLAASPRHLVILTILFREMDGGRRGKTLVPEETLYNEAKVWQIPAHETGAGGVGGMQELTPQAFSRIMTSLVTGNLVRADRDVENDRKKMYSITRDGELALILYSIRRKKPDTDSTPRLP
jgi:hypothetical protein